MLVADTKQSYSILEAEISAMLASESASFMALKKGYLVLKQYLLTKP